VYAEQQVASPENKKNHAYGYYGTRHEYPVILDNTKGARDDSAEEILTSIGAPHVRLQVIPNDKRQDKKRQIEKSLGHLDEKFEPFCNSAGVSGRQPIQEQCLKEKAESVRGQKRYQVLFPLFV